MQLQGPLAVVTRAHLRSEAATRVEERQLV